MNEDDGYTFVATLFSSTDDPNIGLAHYYLKNPDSTLYYDIYAWASCAPEHQIAQKGPLSGGLSFREGVRGRDRHHTSQPKDPDFQDKKV